MTVNTELLLQSLLQTLNMRLMSQEEKYKDVLLEEVMLSSVLLSQYLHSHLQTIPFTHIPHISSIQLFLTYDIILTLAKHLFCTKPASTTTAIDGSTHHIINM